VTIQTVSLNDRFDLEKSPVLLNGTQALVRLMLMQKARDRAAGLNTAGYVTGYRGSPLGAVDMQMRRAEKILTASDIRFQEGLNEDLAATALWGTQQAELRGEGKYDGVFGLWYGKGPGVDRSGDVMRHANMAGTSPHGGVLVVAGDDHGCVSSSMPHQSDVAFMAWFMPTLNPASVAEYLEFAEYGYALSRYSGMWVGFKAISETVEAASSFLLKPDRVFARPDFEIPATGLHYRWPDLPGPQIEERMEAKKHAVFAFAEANPIDRALYGIDDARFGFVSTGKAHLDLMEALRLLGLDEARCRALGIDIYKVGMVWPLARRDALDFVREKREVMVIEEKRGIIESQFKEYFYDWPGHKPQRMVGKNDETGRRLIPWTGELSPRQLAPLIARRLDGVFPGEGFGARAAEIVSEPLISLSDPGATRTPYFCSGCPHNTSTRVPEGSKALAGIGCHFMASWMDRETSSLIQMGGEGVNWAASSRFTGKGHIFQNLGEGTWYHSGSMAIRQAIAANATITYKILYNDAVAMTGGQPVDGPVSVEAIAQICRAEGVTRIALVSDDPEKFSSADFPSGTTIDARGEMDRVQRELREIPGVSVLIYEQTCATEKRRRRKRGELPDPKTFAVINDLVCEGCGDCSTASNCLSVEPKETEFGRKRQINQSNCNKDFSCLGGFCPSFVTIEGAERRKPKPADLDFDTLMKSVPLPDLPALDRSFNLLVTGVGGTGVVTVGALVSMAAHLEGKGASILDFTGFAQKFGAVLSFVRIGAGPDQINQVRIDTGSADAVIGCDIVVSSSPKASGTYRFGTGVALNLASMPTGDLVLKRDADLNIDGRQAAIEAAVGAENVAAFDANAASESLFGDAVFANVMMLGFAWQRGLVPVSLEPLMRAVELNNVAIGTNKLAFACGRLMAADPAALTSHLNPVTDIATSLEEIIARRAAFLEGYQNARWAERYRTRLTEFTAQMPPEHRDQLAVAASKSLFKLMSYKDEYEVARLQDDPAFLKSLTDRFEGDFRIVHHFAPPLMSSGKDARGRPLKRAFGPGIRPWLTVLARLKGLRGTVFDPFGHTAERKMERDLIGWFEALMARCAHEVTPESAGVWVQILAAPMAIRGYGPVKDEAVAKTRAEVEALLLRLG